MERIRQQIQLISQLVSSQINAPYAMILAKARLIVH